MGTTYFLNTSTHQTKLTNLNGSTVLITNSFLKGLYRKYNIPFAGGPDGLEAAEFGGEEAEEISGSGYTSSLGAEKAKKLGSRVNAFLLTIESLKREDAPEESEPIEELVIYAIDLLVPDKDETTFDINPLVVDNNGDNALVQAIGGSADEIQGGVTWEVLTREGVVTDKEKEELKNTIILGDAEKEVNLTFPMPWLIFNKIGQPST